MFVSSPAPAPRARFALLGFVAFDWAGVWDIAWQGQEVCRRKFSLVLGSQRRRACRWIPCNLIGWRLLDACSTCHCSRSLELLGCGACGLCETGTRSLALHQRAGCWVNVHVAGLPYSKSDKNHQYKFECPMFVRAWPSVLQETTGMRLSVVIATIAGSGHCFPPRKSFYTMKNPNFCAVSVRADRIAREMHCFCNRAGCVKVLVLRGRIRRLSRPF